MTFLMKTRSVNSIAGFSLIELMVSSTIGLLLLAALTTVFVNSSQTQKEQQKSMQQIENGRYALDVISQDLRHAGFYGQFYNLPPLTAATIAMPAALPNPCATDATSLLNALPLPVQEYNNPATSPIACLDNANYLANTDILVIRRASTAVLPTSSSPLDNEVYMQSNPPSVEIQIGKHSANLASQKADGNAVDIFKKDGTTPADIRKYHVHIYFISPCSVPTGPATANAPATCQSTDDGGTPIPTLKRLELTAGPTMNLVPLVEGIENLQIDYGVDDTPNVPSSTGFLGDGAPDCYDTDPGSGTNTGISPAAGCSAGNPGSVTAWSEVVTAKVYLLARNPQTTPGYSDAKTYNLGLDFPTVGPKNDRYKRHLFEAVVRLNNSGSRREAP